MPRLKIWVSTERSKNGAAIRSAPMRSPLAQASRILLHFDIAAVPSKLCGDRSLREQLQICEPPFVDFIAPQFAAAWLFIEPLC